MLMELKNGLANHERLRPLALRLALLPWRDLAYPRDLSLWPASVGHLLYDGRFCDRLLPLAFRVRRGFGLDGFLAAALQFFARLALLLRSTRDVRADQSTCLFGLVLRLRRLDLA